MVEESQMTPALAIKLARLQSQFPHKPYSELCAMLARRPRRRKVNTVQNKNKFWWDKD